MKISHLSRRSGVPVPTIKFYLREQLLPPGVPTARNQAEYDESHLHRLRLIRLLAGVGMMSLASVREVLAAIDSRCLSPHHLAQIVSRALLPEQPAPPTGAEAEDLAAEQVDRIITDAGWCIRGEAPERESLVRVVAALEALGVPIRSGWFQPYVEAAGRLAVREIDQQLSGDNGPTVVARVVLFEVAFAIIRRMAYTHHLGMRTAMDTPER
ncbi:MAG: CerR family C-terminal domain-containing protein [Hamadaea sp.]|uniref:MerR family transcriptional regulator n=1 Tax=Hamadaea sp. TaxID=2024425 RepID=UPI0018539929|nr:MerR family transcriptional regulator [Hamadaea sp.]NUT18377.1 CerR family C-terminal domain-containing protein [Hamadaea sp.]